MCVSHLGTLTTEDAKLQMFVNSSTLFLGLGLSINQAGYVANNPGDLCDVASIASSSGGDTVTPQFYYGTSSCGYRMEANSGSSHHSVGVQIASCTTPTVLRVKANENNTTWTFTQVQANTPISGQATLVGSGLTSLPKVGAGIGVTGFGNAANNTSQTAGSDSASWATFPVVSATSSGIVVTNASAVNETHAGTGAASHVMNLYNASTGAFVGTDYVPIAAAGVGSQYVVGNMGGQGSCGMNSAFFTYSNFAVDPDAIGWPWPL